MSAGINEMENRGRESRLAREARVAGRPKDGCRGAPGTGVRVRRNNQNSQNEPGMSGGINEIENRGGKSRLAREAWLWGHRRRMQGAPGTGEGAKGETE